MKGLMNTKGSSLHIETDENSIDLSKIDMSKFEEKMLKTKGIKLPAQELTKVVHKTKGRKPEVLDNYLLRYKIDLTQLDDLTIGAVRANSNDTSHKGQLLSQKVLINILSNMVEISSKAIAINYGYSERHARSYMAACKLVLTVYKVDDQDRLDNLCDDVYEESCGDCGRCNHCCL